MIGWIANAFLIVALFLIGKKWRHAFGLTFVGEVLWLVESWRIERADMVFLCAVFAVMAGWNWWAWVSESRRGLSNAKLKELAETHKPPQSWYDEAGDLFANEPTTDGQRVLVTGSQVSLIVGLIQSYRLGHCTRPDAIAGVNLIAPNLPDTAVNKLFPVTHGAGFTLDRHPSNLG